MLLFVIVYFDSYVQLMSMLKHDVTHRYPANVGKRGSRLATKVKAPGAGTWTTSQSIVRPSYILSSVSSQFSAKIP
jgi:hypothetical protein